MSRLPFFLVLILALAGAVSAQETSWTCPEGFDGQSLNVYNWTTYIAEDTIANFEELCGVSVTYDTFPTDDEMLARIRQGNPGYDIVVPSNAVAQVMVEEGLLLPLNFENIPNYDNVLDELTGLPFDPTNEYTVPYQWGTIGIGYNTTKIEDITTWDDMFAYGGPVSWIEDVRATMGIALVKLGFDPNTDDPEAIGAARDYLIEQGNNVVYINQDDGQEILVRGEADIVVEYSGDIFQIMDECECDDYAYVIPEEGTAFWVDNLAVPVDAPNQALAEVFIDYILDPQVGADISNYTAYASPNAAAIEQELIDDELLNNPGIYPSDEALANMFFIEQDAATEQVYNNAWDEVKIFVGQ